MQVSLPWRGMLPVPDGTIDKPDRYQMGWQYYPFITGPYMIVTMGAYVPGDQATDLYQPGPQRADAYQPGGSSEAQ